jgi:hypothetical protein
MHTTFIKRLGEWGGGLEDFTGNKTTGRYSFFWNVMLGQSTFVFRRFEQRIFLGGISALKGGIIKLFRK